MDSPKRVIEWRSVTGATILAGDRTVTLEARTLVVRLPFGGVAWSRPSAVIVERDGRVERIPIRDVTRLVRLTITALPLVLSLLVVVITSGRGQGGK
jgi:hypothetical protein